MIQFIDPNFHPEFLAQASAWLFQCRCSTQMERNIGSYKNWRQDWWNDLPSVVMFTNHQNTPIQTRFKHGIYSCANFLHNVSSHHTQLSGPRVVKDDLVMHSQQISVLATVCGSATTIHSLWFHIFFLICSTWSQLTLCCFNPRHGAVCIAHGHRKETKGPVVLRSGLTYDMK